MKKIENLFAVTGFIGKDAEIRSFETASVVRFSIAVSRAEKSGEETSYVSAFMGIEAWRKNETVDSFDVLKKGELITVEGYFKPEEHTIDNYIILFLFHFKIYKNKLHENLKRLFGALYIGLTNN